MLTSVRDPATCFVPSVAGGLVAVMATGQGANSVLMDIAIFQIQNSGLQLQGEPPKIVGWRLRFGWLRVRRSKARDSQVDNRLNAVALLQFSAVELRIVGADEGLVRASGWSALSGCGCRLRRSRERIGCRHHT